MSRSTKYKLCWIAFGVLSLAIRSGLSRAPEVIERYYSRGVFLGVRWIFDYFLSWWIPFPLIYLFFLGLTLIVIRKWQQPGVSGRTWRSYLLQKTLGLAAFLGRWDRDLSVGLGVQLRPGFDRRPPESGNTAPHAGEFTKRTAIGNRAIDRSAAPDTRDYR